MTIKLVPPTAMPLATCVRDWDGQTVEFFVLTSQRRSHDRIVDGTQRFQPVAAVARQIVWRGEASPNEMAARAAVTVTHRALCKEPALDLIHAT